MNPFRKCTVLFVACLLCGLVCSGCFAPSAVGDPISSLPGLQSLTATDGNVTFTWERTADGCVFRFHSPAALQKLQVEVRADGLKANCDGLEADVPKSFLSGILPFHEALTAFCEQGANAKQTEEENQKIFRLSLDGTVFLLYYDTEIRAITKLGQENGKLFSVQLTVAP